jgi:uncharacterized Zn finger protein
MNAADVIGYVVKGDYFCPTCTPATEGDDVIAIFGDSETDSFSHCSECEDLIPESLTSEGIERVIESFRDFLVSRRGRAEILSMWIEQVKVYSLESDEMVIVDVTWDALTEVNLSAARAAMNPKG